MLDELLDYDDLLARIADALRDPSSARYDPLASKLEPDLTIPNQPQDEEPELDFWGDDEDDFWSGPKPETTATQPQPFKAIVNTNDGMKSVILDPKQTAQPTSAVPKGWKRDYKNGRIPSNALDTIHGKDSGHRLRPDAAAAYRAMRRAAKRQGIDWGITDSYRDYDTQVRLAEEKGLYSQGGLAAVPGTSEHGWGLATDLDLSPEALAWMEKNAKRFGFHTIPREPWHWEYRGGYKGAPDAYRRPAKKKKRVIRTASGSVKEVGVSDEELITPTSPVVNFQMALLGITGEQVQEDIIQNGVKRGERNVRVPNKAALKAIPGDLRQYFVKASKRTGVPLKLLAAVAMAESGFNQKAGSSAGAIGVMQLMPGTAASLGVDPHNAKQNILGGARYLAQQLEAFGNIKLALAAYNAGPNAVTKYGGIPPYEETQTYVKRVLEYMKGF